MCSLKRPWCVDLNTIRPSYKPIKYPWLMFARCFILFQCLWARFYDIVTPLFVNHVEVAIGNENSDFQYSICFCIKACCLQERIIIRLRKNGQPGTYFEVNPHQWPIVEAEGRHVLKFRLCVLFRRFPRRIAIQLKNGPGAGVDQWLLKGSW
jgi:hypothetical protein